MRISTGRRRRRSGLVILEFSLALPILIMLVLGTTVVGLGVSQYQQVAALAREGSRWASVRGAEYQQVTGNTAATASDIFGKAILPIAVGMPTSDLACQVAWSPNNQPGSTVAVTVTYNWVPSMYLGTVPMSSTSVMTVSY